MNAVEKSKGKERKKKKESREPKLKDTDGLFVPVDLARANDPSQQDNSDPFQYHSEEEKKPKAKKKQ